MAQQNPVTRGGMWNTQKVAYSKDTQQLLKEMMQESKLNNFQKRQLHEAMSGGQSLPSHVNPTSNRKPPAAPQKQLPDPRKEIPSLRSRNEIESSGAYEREQYAPKPLTKFRGFYEKDKERLANIMAYGEDLPPPNRNKLVKAEKKKVVIDRFDELQNELAEREQFLKEMEALGQGEKFRHIIATENSQLLREMEVIDKKRTAELNKLIEERNRQT